MPLGMCVNRISALPDHLTSNRILRKLQSVGRKARMQLDQRCDITQHQAHPDEVITAALLVSASDQITTPRATQWRGSFNNPIQVVDIRWQPLFSGEI